MPPLRASPLLLRLLFTGLPRSQVNWQWRLRQQKPVSMAKQAAFLAKLVLGAGAVAAVGLAYAVQAGYLGPLSSRVRGLFVKHTKTGNPLVDSVAEHQSTRPEM